MSATANTPHTNISQDEWDWVQSLIKDLERQEKQDAFFKFLFQWDQAAREFRKMEQKRVILAEPQENDLRHHATCLHMLLAMGNCLIDMSREFTPEELDKVGNVKHSQIESYVKDLETNYREWHHGFSAEELSPLQIAIFGEPA